MPSSVRNRGSTAHALARAAALCAVLAGASACAGNGGAAAGPLPQFAQYEGREVTEVEFQLVPRAPAGSADSLALQGEPAVPEDSLRRVITTRASSCKLLGFIPFCLFGLGEEKYELDLAVLQRDVARIQLAHRDAGYYGTRVLPVVDEAGDDDVSVLFRVEPGDLVTLTSLEVRGTEGIEDPAEMEKRLPLEEDGPFGRMAFLASVDTVRNRLLDRGHAYAQVLRNYQIDTIADVANVVLEAAPGPVVTIDSIRFVGPYRLSERTLRKQLGLREGRRLRAVDLVRSQRNLFDLELVEFAAVEVAPEHMQLTPDSLELERDSIGSTVLVRVVEAARYAVDLALGVGTRDCGRAQVSHLDRNFLGGARRLEVSGLVAKLGVAGPVQGMEGTFLCDAFDPDRQLSAVDTLIADALNYRLAFNFLQPRLFGTQTSVVAGGFYERISELNLYLRDDFGGELGVVRQIQNNTLASLTFNVQRGRTRASDYFFCIAYEVCNRADIARLERTRWSNALTLGAVRSRVRLDPFPRTGYQARGQVDYASAALGSEDDYLRVYLDGIRHAPLRENMVLSVRLMGGSFLTGLLGNESGYIPPERRFYGGGPTGVRGFRFNELGPTVYIARPRRKGDGGIEVDTVASSTGGTRTLLGTAELTFPLLLPPERFRAAVFVDAGQVWASQDALASRPGIRFTPGIGGRFASPVGPLRFDVAYNPYPRERGPLYGINERGELLEDPLFEDFAPAEARGFLRRLVLQFSVGQAL